MQSKRIISSGFHRAYCNFAALAIILGGAALAVAQNSAPRPAARLVASFESERRAAPSPPNKLMSSSQATVQTRTPATRPISAHNANKTAVSVPQTTFSAETLEQRVLALVNEERGKRGLPALSWDKSLARMARAHAESMAAQGFFSHTDPQGRDAVARARETGVSKWRALSENIAYNKGYDQPADFAVERWLLSAPHRENIAKPLFTHTAVGVAIAADGRIYFTQVFLAR